MCHHYASCGGVVIIKDGAIWEESVLVDYGGIAPMKIWLNPA